MKWLRWSVKKCSKMWPSSQRWINKLNFIVYTVWTLNRSFESCHIYLVAVGLFFINYIYGFIITLLKTIIRIFYYYYYVFYCIVL